MHIELFTICDHAQIIGDKLIVVGPFDLISTRTPAPIMLNQCALAMRVRVGIDEPLEFPATFRIQRVSDGAMVVGPLPGNFKTANPGNFPTAVAQAAMSFVGLTFNEFGDHAAVLAINGKDVCSAPIYVRKIAEK